MSAQAKGILFTVASAIIFGCMPLFAKSIYASGANAPTLVLLRFSLSLPVLCLLAKRTGGTFIQTRELKKILVLSTGFILTPVLLFSSYSFISTGAATTIHFVYPACVLAGCVLFLRQPVTKIKLIAALLSTVGVALFYQGGAQANALGIILAFLSGVTYAFYIVYLDCSGLKEMPSFRISFYLSATSALLLLTGLGALGQLRFPTTAWGWGLSLLFSLLLSVGAIVLFQEGVRTIGAQKAAILSTFEPITGIVMGILVFQESFLLRAVLGMILILTATVLISAFDR